MRVSPALIVLLSVKCDVFCTCLMQSVLLSMKLGAVCCACVSSIICVTVGEV